MNNNLSRISAAIVTLMVSLSAGAVPELFAPGVISTGDDESHPEFSPDGSSLYFGSEREGGVGGSDIWFSRRQGDRYGEPQNVGAPVNSDAMEIEAWIAPDDACPARSYPRIGDGCGLVFRK